MKLRSEDLFDMGVLASSASRVCRCVYRWVRRALVNLWERLQVPQAKEREKEKEREIERERKRDK